MLTILFFT